MIYFKKILQYARPYKLYAVLNIIFNIFYAIFSALSFIVLMPLFQVIFKTDEKIVYEEPIFKGFTSGMEYLNDYFNYYVSTLVGENQEKTLLFVVLLIVVIFLLKNLFSYLAFYYITFLKNGVLKDIRNDLYHKTISLPISYFSEKKKGDIMARIGPDVIEVHYSFLSILELIFRDPIMILVTIISMLAISVKLTIFIFVFVPIAGFIINILGNTISQYYQ